LQHLQGKAGQADMKVVEILNEALDSLSVKEGALVHIRLGFDPFDSRNTNGEIEHKNAPPRKKPRSRVFETQRKEKYTLGCSNKTRFKSLEHAKEAKKRIRYISAMESSDGKASSRLPSRAYACGNCKGFHLSSHPDLFEVRFELAA
jgi:hypothetical protein